MSRRVWISHERRPRWKESGGIDLDGFGLSDGYRWIISVYIFGFHFIVGRDAPLFWARPRRFLCWLRTRHDIQDNNLTRPDRRYYCTSCHTVWDSEMKRSRAEI